MLCICRGIQVLNVGLGGTLYQDLPDQFGQRVAHRQQALHIESAEPSHQVEALPDSLLARVYASTTIRTNSFHHQAVKELAPALVAEGRSEDGLVEAVSLPSRSFVLGLQWHPELMFHRHQDHLLPFARLVETALSRSLATARA
jgi:putative glutamine amidotransferase